MERSSATRLATSLTAVTVAAAAMLGARQASAETWTTGVVEHHIAAGSGRTYAPRPLQQGARSATLVMRYGLWDSPDTTLEVYVNGTRVGQVVATGGWTSPGPAEERFDVRQFLRIGTNTIEVRASQGGGVAVMGQLTLEYSVK